MLTTDILSWKQLSQRQQKPVHLILFITDHCNAKCGTCFYWQNLNQGEALQPDHIQKISEAMGELVWPDIPGGRAVPAQGHRPDLPSLPRSQPGQVH